MVSRKHRAAGLRSWKTYLARRGGFPRNPNRLWKDRRLPHKHKEAWRKVNDEVRRSVTIGFGLVTSFENLTLAPGPAECTRSKTGSSSQNSSAKDKDGKGKPSQKKDVGSNANQRKGTTKATDKTTRK